MDEGKEKKELLQRAQQLCSVREYCVSDIISLLTRWEASDDTTKNEIIDKLKEDKFIDEARYCSAFARDHFRYNQWGRLKITMALKAKKIPDTDISTGLETIDGDEYLDLLRKIIVTQQKKIKAKNRFDMKGKLLRHALGKGFESHLVYDVINSLFSD